MAYSDIKMQSPPAYEETEEQLIKLLVLRRAELATLTAEITTLNMEIAYLDQRISTLHTIKSELIHSSVRLMRDVYTRPNLLKPIPRNSYS